MSKEISRRDFLRVGAAAGIAGLSMAAGVELENKEWNETLRIREDENKKRR